MTILRVTRREFVAALGGAGSAAWPVVAREGDIPSRSQHLKLDRRTRH